MVELKPLTPLHPFQIPANTYYYGTKSLGSLIIYGESIISFSQ